MSQIFRRSKGAVGLIGALSLSVLSCTRDKPKQPLNVFPVRLLTVPDFSPQTLLEVSWTKPADLDGWWIPGAGSPGLRPAADHYRPDPTAGLILKPGDSPLIRLIELPADAPMTLEARLSRPLPVPDGRQSDLLLCFPLGVLELTGRLEQVLASGRVGLPSRGTADLSGMVSQRLAALQGARPARRTNEQNVVLEVPGPRAPELWVVALQPGASARAFGSLRLLREPSPDLALRAARPHREVLSGEERVVVRIAPGERYRATARAPRGTTRLSFGLAPEESGRFAREPLIYSLSVLQGNRELLQSEEKIERWDSRQEAFRDRELPWPTSFDPDLPVELVAQNRGVDALILAQPMLRGKATDTRPNLLLISLDTLRDDHLSGSGYDRPTSPFLDSFAAESTRFENYRAVASHTLPTHVSMLTGLLPIQHRVTDMTRRLEPRVIPFLPALLAQRGYATAAFTGGGFVSAAFGLSHGFDRFSMNDPLLPEEGVGLLPKRAQPGRRTLQDVARWIESRRQERWFVLVHTYAIHNYFAPAKIVEQFDRKPDTRWRDDLSRRLNPPYWRVPEQAPNHDDVRHLVDLYDATIRYADQELERFFERLKSQGLLEDTLVVITSDHGEEFLEHGGLQHSLTLFEEQLAVPLFIRAPGQQSGQRVLAPMSQADLAPTLLDLMRLREHLPEAAVWQNSRAGLLITGSDEGSRTPFLAHLDLADARAMALRQGDLKILWGDTSEQLLSPARREWELYNLRLDPHETDDLSATRPVLLEQARRRLAQVEQQLDPSSRAVSSRPLDGSVLEQLRALGYVR